MAETITDAERVVEFEKVKKKLLEAQKLYRKMRPMDTVLDDLIQNVLDDVDCKIDAEKNAGLPVACAKCGFTAAGNRGLEVHDKMRHTR